MLPRNRFPLGPGGVRPSAVATSSASVCSFPMIGASGSYDLSTTSLPVREPPRGPAEQTVEAIRPVHLPLGSSIGRHPVQRLLASSPPTARTLPRRRLTQAPP